MHAQSVPFGTWFHMAVTTSANFVSVYFNGAFVASDSEPISTPAGTSFSMGSIAYPFGTTRQLVGAVDEVSVVARALTSAEIAAIFAAGSAGKCR